MFAPCRSLFCALVFAPPLFSVNLPAQAHSSVFNIADYGAHSGASATEAIRSAILAAKATGGGTIQVPPGHYTSGPIELFSNMTLEVQAGAVLEFPAQLLPFTPGRQQGIETITPVPLIGGHDVENVSVIGRGVLTSSNADWMKLHSRIVPGHAAQNELNSNAVSTAAAGKKTVEELGSANGPTWEHLLLALDAGQQISDKERLAAAAEMRPSFIRFMHAKNVLVDGLRFEGSPMWTIHLLYSENATVHGVIIETHPGVHSDGIVVDSSRFVRISDSYIDTGDDGIVIKSGKDADGRRVHRPTEDVVITNCTVHHAHGAVTIGSETSGSVRNIAASNITAVDTENGIRIKSRRGRGGVIEDLRFDNWTMRNVGAGIVVTSYYRMEGEAPPQDEPFSERTPVFRNIAFSHFTIDGARSAVEIEGLPEAAIQGLRLTDIVATSEKGLSALKTDGLKLHQVQMNVTQGPAFLLDRAAHPELDGIGTRTPLPEQPVLRITHSTDVVLRNSRALPGTSTFLSTGPGELEEVQLVGNVLDAAEVAAQER